MTHQPFHPSDLTGADESVGQSASSSAEALAMARELEGLDAGAIRPSDGFTDRVFAAISREPLPQPMAVAGIAAREGRLGALVGALRDTWRVALSGSRPMAVRAPAMAFVLIVILALGSAGGLAAVGAYNALVPPDRATPSAVLPSSSPEPTETPEATETPGATETPEGTETPEATETPQATETPEATRTPEATKRPGATATPEATRTPEATQNPGATETPEGGDTSGGAPGPGETLKPGETPNP